MRVLEFYSGIGGMHYALQKVCAAAIVLDAFDVNHAANAVYAHNFGKAPRQVDLVSLTAAELDAYAADLWLLAPPCQPFTRQGKQLAGADARSSSFMHLLQQLQHMQAQPKGLLVENVVGFDGSDVQAQLAAALAACGYHTQEFILTPLQYGVPYSRPRYFCVASKQPLPVPVPGLQQPCLCTPSLLLQLQRQGAEATQLLRAAQQHLASHVQHVPTLAEFLALPVQHSRQEQQHTSGSRQQAQQTPQQQQHHQLEQQQARDLPHQQPQHQLEQQQAQHLTHQQPQHQLEQQRQQEQQLERQQQQHGQSSGLQAAAASGSVMHQWSWVADKVLQKHADVIDVVCHASRSCNCFTKAYGHFARGTGSLLATVPDPAAVDNRWQLVQGSGSLELRGYTPPAARHINSEGDSRLGMGSAGQPHASQPCFGAAAAVATGAGAGVDAAAAAGGVAGASADAGVGADYAEDTDSTDWEPSRLNGVDPSCLRSALGAAGGASCSGEVLPGSDELVAAWRQLGLRYFTVGEIAQLHSFPASFSLPPGVGSRQGYQLLGNSLSVAVVADLLGYLLMSLT